VHWGGGGRGDGGDSGHDGSDIGSNYSGICSRVGVEGETGSGYDGRGDCVKNTSDSGAGGGGSGINHTRGTGNSGYSGGMRQLLLPLLLLMTSLPGQISLL